MLQVKTDRGRASRSPAWAVPLNGNENVSGSQPKAREKQVISMPITLRANINGMQPEKPS
jgi:hypothetical protein